MNYWERQGWEDAWLGYKAKSLEWFQAAQQVQHYERYMSGYRCGREQLIQAAGDNRQLKACL